MVSFKNIFILASVASAMVLEKRGTYLDLYTDIGRGMREIRIQTDQWNGAVYPDAIITAINQMNDAIAAADRRTRNDGGSIEDRDSLALIHFIHLTAPGYVTAFWIALEVKKTVIDLHPPATQTVHDKFVAARDSWRDLWRAINSRTKTKQEPELHDACEYIYDQFDGIVIEFTQQ